MIWLIPPATAILCTIYFLRCHGIWWALVYATAAALSYVLDFAVGPHAGAGFVTGFTACCLVFGQRRDRGTPPSQATDPRDRGGPG